jgi:hypothetical protein
MKTMTTELKPDTTTFAELVARAGGVQAVANELGVGKDWVYRRINGETPIKKKDELLVAKVKRKKRKSVS